VAAVAGKVETLVVTAANMAHWRSAMANERKSPRSRSGPSTPPAWATRSPPVLVATRGASCPARRSLGAIAAAEVIQHYGARPEKDLLALAGELI
jgi:hypothetical protein